MIELPGSEISSAAIGTEQDVIGAKKDVILLYFASGSELLGHFTFFGSLGFPVLFKLAVLVLF